MIRITTFTGRRVAVFGLGASGIATAKALADGGADVVCSDDSAAGVKGIIVAQFVPDQLSFMRTFAEKVLPEFS